MTPIRAIATLAATLAATCGHAQTGQESAPQLVSQDGSITCSRAEYLDYRAISLAVGKLVMDFSPVPQSAADKQRVIDGLASAKPAGDATQSFAAYIPTGEVFRTECAASTCTMDEMWQPMTACQTAHWDDCIPALVRYGGRNYCLLDPAEDRQ